jgi:hypothetical protein
VQIKFTLIKTYFNISTSIIDIIGSTIIGIILFCFNIINNSISDNLWEQRLPIIREEKQKVLNYYNFFPTVERILFEDFKFSPHPTDEEIDLKKRNIHE